ncbi:delta-lactam-biosynthetic de-N-acetylase [Cecembia lonarensis LW9]|uniref:Delta-lactam-biosynthetic de-N-acetylase n=2 Tax=Cecembia TaxID=1187078 RepID=K1LJC1_CECL9|nr:delta-lactam-biosynthetic de-N-acetylase [Cecembia lonarensis LW9]
MVFLKMVKFYSMPVFAMIFLSLSLNCYSQFELSHGAIIRGDISLKKIALVFTGHDHAEGGEEILKVLEEKEVPGAFFLTGDFLRNPDFKSIIHKMITDGHYVGPHSDKHLLYCTWEDREMLLIDKEKFFLDLDNNYQELERFGLTLEQAAYFLPPYEWYNITISEWASEFGAQLINFTPGTRSHADYTDPSMPNYINSQDIMRSIYDYEKEADNGLNGFILLSHIGVGQNRTDKFYKHLPHLIDGLQVKGYKIVALEELLKENDDQ